ncbi:MAG: abortive infection protein [Cyanobacteria bacterium RYN_339]|nr:abortive infection protein [Cyanobacteria bacterium RYN_339]
MYRRSPPPVRIGAYLLACALLSVVWCALIWAGCRPGLDVWIRPDRYPLAAGLYLAGTYAVLVGGAWFCWRRLQGGTGRELGLIRGPFLGPLALGLGSLGGLFALEILAGVVEWHPVATPPAAVLATAASALFFGASEELLFRGFIYRTLRRGWGVPASVLASSTFYAGLHFLRLDLAWTQVFTPFLGLTLAGALLSWAVERTRSLAPAIGLHAAWVFLFLLTDGHHLIGYPPPTNWLTGGGYPLGGVSALVLLLALWALLARVLQPRAASVASSLASASANRSQA